MDKIFHTVLALKYRPQKFSDLIGQETMVQTITNSIKLNKLPNAYLLTGIRGVGKTTTARIIAKALNCKNDFEQNEKSKTGESCKCEHCEAISKSNHIDVLEMDAASRTGIDDIRELIETSKYNPSIAKYKIFIIDEVHMLSKQAFNGLLKTLEEPPKHLKFIFATTEANKIPITIISRCQRFDLRRINLETIVENLRRISEIEKGKISERALELIARASDGSVRDSLSLLDKALISQKIEDKEIDEIHVQKILGLVDKTKIIELFEKAISGNYENSISNLQSLIDDGIDPRLFLNEFLEIIFLVSSIKKLNLKASDYSLNTKDFDVLKSIADQIDLTSLFTIWQFTLNTIKELPIVQNQIISLKVFIIRLAHLKDLPNLEEIINNENDISKSESLSNIDNLRNYSNNPKDKNNNESNDQIKNIIQTKPIENIKNKSEESLHNKTETIGSFDELLKLVSKKREIELKYDLENNVNLIKFSECKIAIGINENLSKNFIRKLSEKLFEWTKKRWIISLSKTNGQKTFKEQKKEKLEKQIQDGKNSKVFKEFIKYFPDGELIDVKEED